MPMNFTIGNELTPRFGTHEILLQVDSGFGNPYRDVDFKVIFTRPDSTSVEVEGFYDGGNDFRARAYCDMAGNWIWRSKSNHTDLSDCSGSFDVIPSSLKGKLRIHAHDKRQFAYDNGEWFLHIGDTAYRYVCDAEPYWREYIQQAAIAGMTKIRTWFCRGRNDVQALLQADRTRLNLSYWREIDRRIQYALNHFPHIILQLIPFGEDAEEVYRYFQGDAASFLIASHAQARFSSFANVTWCISNDLRIVENIESGFFPTGWEEEKKELRKSIDSIGRDMAEREPWGTLLTNHQHRFSGYSFVESSWSDIVTLEDLGQVTGELILKYRSLCDNPVVLEEDRYEHHKEPGNPRYFFRRLMWASLLSGGQATYCGTLNWFPYDGDRRGIQGYYRACREGKLKQGAHDFRLIHQFFNDTGITLIDMVPDDRITGNNPLCIKAMRSLNSDCFIVYLANPDVFEGHTPDGFEGNYTDEIANPAEGIPEVTLELTKSEYSVRWFNPSDGSWQSEESSHGGMCLFKPPVAGDWILLLQKEVTCI